MTDKDNIMIEDFFKQAAQQQIEDNGFTERVMQNLPETVSKSRRLSLLWTLFCIALGVVIFFICGGWDLVQLGWMGALRMVATSMEVFMVTAPTTEITLNLWVLLGLAAFVLVYLPYQTGRKLSSVL